MRISVIIASCLMAAYLIASGGNKTTMPHLVQDDGPYVFRGPEWIHARYIMNDHGTRIVKSDSVETGKAQQLMLNVATDQPGQFFAVKLKKEMENEKPDHDGKKKIFVVSDIEGNFAALRKLLQANQVIDAQLNWSYGDGQLVLTGDFVDRGTQVTEVLWLIYSLEEKAKAAGGQVHFVLGNHEIMNMSADFRYVHGKYMESARLMGAGYMELFNEQSELGRWLRTKNIAEKIGKYLFVHGGISREVMLSDISLNKMNKLARPFYADTTFNYKDQRTALLFSDLGPFWYRGYYTGNSRPTPEQVDAILDYYDVKHIVTGHTVVSDTVSVLMNGKIINTDVPHAKGRSEALLIEGANCYRVNDLGEKFPL